ncbi:ubiquitin-like-conjugating enzyme ATG10 isoform X5 [Hippoglossus hippoglossus]|uniref:ubiquitin-like-conjugating enzyme ATG10 isoform X5 n=1 Tax=Hippoglossus hippoglossus TaxID=8267 RepID=UPI00148C7AAB|nr:ubiquitin-like-conjugating enzyme ATG10 isoform X5 [Hippoglossus hippoglossus]
MGLESKCQGHVSDDPGDYWRRSCPPPGSLAVMELCVQEETFHHCCQLLLQQSEQLRDGWSWESVQSALVASFDADNIEEDIADDDGGVCSVSKDSREVLQYEYHILYSCSYSTPVLYFRAFTLEGRSLSLEEVWSSVHPNFRIRLQNSPLNTITQQEHPLLGQPFFMLHPCKTEEFMKPVLQLAQDQHRPVNYVLTWLSVVGPLVGLDVPLMYFTLLLPSPALLSNNKPN